MKAHRFFSGLRACLRTLLAVLLLWAAAGGSAQAQTYVVRNVVINGGTTTVNTGVNTYITVDVTVQNYNFPWRTTSFVFSPGGAGVCVVSENGSFVGTRTVRYSIQVPSTQNVFSLAVAVHSHSSCKTVPGHTSSAAYGFPNAVNTKPVVVGVDHLQIEHDGIGRTCSAKTITIKACADAACSSLYTQAVTMNLTANNSGVWSPATQTFSGGTTTATLSRNAAVTVTMGGSISSPVPKSTTTTCLRSGVLGSCDVVFSASSCRLDAVEVTKGAGTPIYTKTTAGFSLDVLNLSTTGALSPTTADIKAQLVDEASCANPAPAVLTTLSPEVTGAYLNASRMTFAFAPTTASRNARVRIVNGPLIGCSTDKFAIRPASFTVTAPTANAHALGTNAAATPILKAGTTPFTMTAVSSAGYSNQPQINDKRLDAGAGVPGDLVGTFVAGTGTASGSFTYSEAGYVRLAPYTVYDNSDFTLVDSVFGECVEDDAGALIGTATLTDGNVPNADGKISCYFGNPQTVYFGRFVPDRFVLDAATLTDRFALASCPTPGGFTYMGEEMRASIALTAVNGSGGTTENYAGSFNRMPTPATQLGINAINDAPAPTGRTAFPQCGTTAAHPCIKTGAPIPDPVVAPALPVTPTFVAGVASFNVPVTVFRPTAPVGPYDMLKVGVAPIDLDGVTLATSTYNVDTVTVPTASATNNHVLLATSKARYGRLHIDNAYGSELLNLSMPVSAQYWNSTGYATNRLDSCTALPATDFTLSDHLRGITTGNMPASHIMAGTTLANGKGRVVLKKPSTAPIITGSVVLKSNSVILPGSGGRGTFGVYKAGPVIYVRETY